jgi:hypothetical protein
LGKVTTAAQFVLVLVLLAWPDRAAVFLLSTMVLSGLAAADYVWVLLVKRSR